MRFAPPLFKQTIKNKLTLKNHKMITQVRTPKKYTNVSNSYVDEMLNKINNVVSKGMCLKSLSGKIEAVKRAERLSKHLNLITALNA